MEQCIKLYIFWALNYFVEQLKTFRKIYFKKFRKIYFKTLIKKFLKQWKINWSLSSLNSTKVYPTNFNLNAFFIDLVKLDGKRLGKRQLHICSIIVTLHSYRQNDMCEYRRLCVRMLFVLHWFYRSNLLLLVRHEINSRFSRLVYCTVNFVFMSSLPSALKYNTIVQLMLSITGPYFLSRSI